MPTKTENGRLTEAGMNGEKQYGDYFPSTERDDLEKKLKNSQSLLKLRDQQLQRLSDLVRYQRAELHDADLITDDEYCALLSDGNAVARLETYDDMRKQIGEAKELLKKLLDARDPNTPVEEYSAVIRHAQQFLHEPHHEHQS